MAASAAAAVRATAVAATGAGARSCAWRAHAYGALGELRLEEARVPVVRAPDQLLVRVTAAGVNPLDVAMVGGYGRVALNTLRALEAAAAGGAGGGGDEFPLVPGRELVGEVVRAGAEARLRPGARVWAVLPPHWAGAHAQHALVRDAWAARAPAALDRLRAGGALYAGLTACAALRAAGLPAERPAGGARVLLLGAGGVGQAALQLLVAAGARVSVACAPELADWALAAGALEALDRRAEDHDARLARGGPYAAVLDCAGLGGREAGARRWRFGRYVTLTTPLLREMDARGALAGAAAAACELARQSAAARRACGGSVRWAYFAPRAADVALLGALASRGAFAPRVQAAVGWRQAPRAYALQAAGHARGKVLIDFTDDSPAIAPAAPC